MQFQIKDLTPISSAINAISKVSMYARAASKLARFNIELLKQLESAEAQRIALLNKYGEKQTDGKVGVKAENAPAFQQAYTTLLETPVEIPFTQIPLKDIEGVSMTIAVMTVLLPLFTE